MSDSHQLHDDPSDHDRSSQPASRRTLLRAAGLVALTGGGITALSACSAEGGTAAAPSASAPAPSESSAPGTPSAAASPSESAAASKSATQTAEAPKGPSVATSKVPVGSGVILDDADYVVTQPTKGDFKAFSKICTHQRCPVAEVNGANIVCKCHGSQFSIKDGSVTNPPASRPLAESKVKVFDGKAYVTG